MLFAIAPVPASRSYVPVGDIQDVTVTMHRSECASGHEMPTMPEAGRSTSPDLPVAKSSLTTRPRTPLEYTTNRKSLLLAIFWMGSCPSGTTVSASFQSGCSTLVLTTLYLGASVCVSA